MLLLEDVLCCADLFFFLLSSFFSLLSSFCFPFSVYYKGMLSEKSFGFVYDANKPINEWDSEVRAVNTKALGSALLTVNLFAMCGSLVLYSLMFFTYPHDAQNASNVEAENVIRLLDDVDSGDSESVSLLSGEGGEKEEQGDST